ncbi:hypothetical protein NDU88_002001, partial [Pleurodeles waltl]
TLHSLDIKRCLKCYLQKTQVIRLSDQLFVAFGGTRKGHAVSKQTIARWIGLAIQFCHAKAGKPLHNKVRAHSTRSVATSAALFAG